MFLVSLWNLFPLSRKKEGSSSLLDNESSDFLLLPQRKKVFLIQNSFLTFSRGKEQVSFSFLSFDNLSHRKL